MRASRAPATRLAAVIWAMTALATGPRPAGAAVLASARADIVFHAPTSCTVVLALTIEGAGEVEHRLEVAEGGHVELTGIDGATAMGGTPAIGRTRALVLRPGTAGYSLRYSVELPADRSNRCPLWIPTIPADGLDKPVRIAVRLPAGATAAGSMPAFTWSAAEGTATLGHLPAFVRVQYHLPGESAPRDIARLMDVFSILVLVAATAVWGLARKGR